MAEEFRDRYRCFVVDEYQDVTPLQQRVLDAWLGERDDLTVVGDANQTIYSFTGATPRLPARLPAPLPRGHGGAAGARLPVHPAGGVAGQPGDRRGARPGRGHPPAARRAAARRARTRCSPSTTTSRPRPRPSRARSSGWSTRHAGRRDRGAVPDQRPVGGLRAGAHRGGDPVPGARRRAVLLRVPRCAGDAALRQAAARGDRPERRGAGRSRWCGRCWSRWGSPTEPPGGAAQRALGVAARAGRAGRGTRRRRASADLPRFAARTGRARGGAHPPTVQGVTLASLHAAKGLEWDAVFLVGLVDGTLPIQQAPTADRRGDRGGAAPALRRRHAGAASMLALSWALSRHPGRPRAAAAAASSTGWSPTTSRRADRRTGGRTARRREAALPRVRRSR